MNRCILWAILILSGTAVSYAQEFSSGPVRTALIELFTSEGCSSCPPADQRMNALAGDKKLWIDFVPVAFHVDYWNYLGWPDPLSSAEYSTRQRKYTKEWGARTSYTPCFVVNGVAARKPVPTGPIDQAGILKMTLTGNTAKVTFAPTTGGDYMVWLAPLSGKLSYSITAGENRGRKLEHCFVALGLVNEKMISNGRIYSATLTVPTDNRTRAIAIWVSPHKSLKPLQATGGWIKSL